MGVPKFYRWISERYPCLSEVVKEYQIPEFDNLYLDMNGIIHVCSHPNDNDPHFRMTEEKMFKDIFHYIEVLFRLIQPKKVFFMAVDGVAPRAKMNQQRGRRFRSAREAVDNEKKALERGEKLPTEERFDSNCITPGTAFMERLDHQLQYFVTYKLSQDRMWKDCKIIYSGHQTPGEGEHKIMEYIRYTKSQPGYDPNVRHCLYGLDADLMMLGLTSHEPHFSLLREEVRFGGKNNNSRTPSAEETTFHLLHLGLMREYINYEFIGVKKNLPFKYDLEKIIDDWVLMGFLVGNDFIPHLPNLHINKDALPTLYGIYKEVLPTLDGYLNDGGSLHLGRFEKFMAKLAEFEINIFQDLNADLKFFNSKKLDDGNAFPVNKSSSAKMQPLQLFEFDDDSIDDDIFDPAATLSKLNIEQPDLESSDEESGSDSIIDDEFRHHKRNYYMTKMHYKTVNSEVLREQATCYVRGIQWILNYYYNGICSWSWFYPFHYSPYISDIKNFADMKMGFEMGKPFMPYEQLLAVLPPLSVILLPKAYHGLMMDSHSPLKPYYPESFETDLNGKQQDWEAVVLIPFIDETKLLIGMQSCNGNLTPEEKVRNVHGPMYIYTWTMDHTGEYKAPKYFPPVSFNHAKLDLLHRDYWEMLPEKIYKGLCQNVKQELYFAGFPTLKHVTHTFHVGKEAIKVFQQNSRGDNYILDVQKIENPDLRDLANQILGKIVFIAWPHLVEAKVQGVSDGKEKYYWSKGEVKQMTLEGATKEEFHSSKKSISTNYHDRWGVNVGETDILVYAAAMTGRSYVPSSDGRISLEKSWSSIIQPYAYQVIVRNIAVYDPGYKEHLTPEQYFPPRTKVFMLGQPHYGSSGEVIEINPSHRGRIRVVMTVSREPSFDAVKQKQNQLSTQYLTGYQMAQKLGISSHLSARLTGTVFLAAAASEGGDLEMRNKLNIGLNLKNNVKNEEVAGYTRRNKDHTGRTQWLYSQKCVDAINEYQSLFPEVFDYLTSHLGEKYIFFQDDVFSKENYKERVAALTTWLKNAAFNKAERRMCGTLTLDDPILDRIVEEVDKATTVRAQSIKMQVRPHLLFKPNPLQGSTPPDRHVTYELFDRIVNCREGYSVPLGAKGTIIGIQPADKDQDIIYDILFDEAFAEGMTLGGPSTSKRCYRLHWATMINISHGSRTNSTANEGDNGVINAQQNSVAYSNQEKYNRGQMHQPPNIFHSHQHRNKHGPPSNYQQQMAPVMYQQQMSSLGYQQQMPPHLAQQMWKSSQDYNNFPREQIEIKNAKEIDCLVHGTYYSYWSKIHLQGLSRINGRDIVCYTCVPKSVPGPKAFQLHIHIDVRMALNDGIKFFRVNDKQATCSGDSQGLLHPKYFIKVIDCETNTVIFPKQMPGNNNFSVNGAEQPEVVTVGRGRGQVLGSHPQGIKLHEEIWSQLQRDGKDQDSTQPIQMQSQMLSQMLNITENDASDNRTEVSVQDIFRGAQNIHAYSGSDKGNQGNSNASTLPKPIQNTSNSLSPSKSAFVPTQVIRKQTPRKSKPQSSEDTSKMDCNTSNPSSVAATSEIEKKVVPSPQKQQQHQQTNHKSNKSKRPARSRLAVRFPVEDT